MMPQLSHSNRFWDTDALEVGDQINVEGKPGQNTLRTAYATKLNTKIQIHDTAVLQQTTAGPQQTKKQLLTIQFIVHNQPKIKIK